jgi:probable rRNA maturation factor
MRVAERVMAWERAPAGSHVEITLLPAAAMRRANRRATGRRGLTDVIAYPLPQPDGSLWGDVYICPAAAADAARNGAGLNEELVRLAVHGTLHVLGYDHPEDSRRTRSRMWQLQERYVKRLIR